MINRVINDPQASREAGPIDIREPSASARQRLGPLWRRVQTAVAENPKTSLLAALTAGVLLGWIIKRR